MRRDACCSSKREAVEAAPPSARRPSSTRARGTQDGARRPRASRRPSPAPPSSARVDGVGSPVASPRTAGVHLLVFRVCLRGVERASRRTPRRRRLSGRVTSRRGRATGPSARTRRVFAAAASRVGARPRARVRHSCTSSSEVFSAELAGSISAPAHRASRASRTLPAGAERTPVTANASASTRGVPASTRAPAVTPRWP